ncbi:peptidoglycan DD-metalloendopeptidase family protein [Dokdonia ponticola]|uniref:Peptidoglycan DD-metalloendopeptidase family protein n=1 Tax=Dokdonia ponticola TaxID=2041041 RepID=A0ABV9HTY2_9FLAO
MLSYLFQVMIAFSVLYVLYRFVFSTLTFHSLNRVVLLAILPLSIGLPLLTHILPPIVHPIQEIPQLVEQMTIVLTTSALPAGDEHVIMNSFNYWILVYTSYFLGLGIYLLRFCVSIHRLFRIKKKATGIRQDDHVLYQAPVSNIFSYFHWIFVPQSITYDPLIIAHEKAHSQFKHTIDILLVEIYIAFFWWNPLVYLYRKSLKSVHEYQADQCVLREDVKTSDYLQLIAQSLEIKRPNQLYSYFNTPILKKRIDMMTKKTSHNRSKLMYFLLLPVAALCFIAFTKPMTAPSIVQDTLQIIKHTDITPTLAFPIEGGSTQQITAFFDADIKDPTTKKEKVHTGIDIRAAIGTPIIATADGTVFLSREVGAWGNLIKIQHQDGYETWYAHLKDFNTHYGKSVKKGDVIGYVGITGNSSGPHLHFELKHDKQSLNPLNYFEK